MHSKNYLRSFKSFLIALRKDLKNNYQLYFLLALPVAYIVVFHYVPLYGAQIAFRNFNASGGIIGSPWVGFDQFINFFSSYQFARVIKNTLIISIYSLIAGFPFPIILAIMLNNTKNVFYKKFVQLSTYAPYFISTVVMVGIVLQFLSLQYGIVNRVIRLMGFDEIMFMGESSMLSSVYVWSGIWQTTGWGSIIYISALSAIDPTLYEAAKIDGAGKMARIMHIDLPGILPTMTIMLILSFGDIMSIGYEKILLLQNPMNLEASEVISTYIYKVGLAARIQNYSFGTAIGLFNSVINFVLILIVNAISKRISETSLW